MTDGTPVDGSGADERAMRSDGGERSDAEESYLSHRRERLSAFLDSEGLDAVWFGRPNSFSWLTGGSNVVNRDDDVGVAAAGYLRSKGFAVVTNNIEAQRLADEELPAAFDVESVPWYESSLASAVADATSGNGAADFDVPGLEPLNASGLRRPLSAGDIERYRTLGREVAAALERVAIELQPDDTESEVAAGLRVALSTRGIESPVVLVGGAERAQSYRHYTPSRNELGSYALLTVTAERGGLYVSATRTVAFDGAPEWLKDRHHTAMRVEASALAATREASGGSGDSGDVFDAIRDAYDDLGEADEWQKHHQGGAAGFSGREWIATPDSDDWIDTPMAYAYNPTVRGAKSEDTALITDDGVEILTRTGEWPTRTVSSYDGEFTIERHAVRRLGGE
jgi:Xaa-Pro aminopeptidase